MVGVDLPIKVAGLLVLKELQAFSKVLNSPQTPLVAIVGGAKISDKIKLIDNLIDKADGIIICGGMAYTFLKVCFGMKIGKSLFDKKGADIVQGILDKAKAKGCEVTLPVDWTCGQDFCNDQELKLVTQEEGIPDGWEGMDCGPKSMELFASKISKARTVVWNGPAGVFEFPNFAKGTKAILDAVAALHAAGGIGMIGGGDSATAAANAGMEDKVSFVSTGGGASLELLEGKHLPGIVCLADQPSTFYHVTHTFKPGQAESWWKFLGEDGLDEGFTAVCSNLGFYNHAFMPVSSDGPIYCTWEAKCGITDKIFTDFIEGPYGPTNGCMDTKVEKINMELTGAEAPYRQRVGTVSRAAMSASRK